MNNRLCISSINFIFIFILSCQLFNCEQSETADKNAVATKKVEQFSKEDYAEYLEPGENKEKIKQQEEFAFWEAKLDKAPNQFPFMLKMATAANKLFDITGDVKYLNTANDLLEKTNKMVNRTTSSHLRSAARCYITQHRFKDAHQALLEAEELGGKPEETNKMLFDINMELGNYDVAKSYLDKLEKKSSFDHLIRMSKWEDHIGNLDRAIVYMQSSLDNASRQENESLMMWSYTNLADYYGHAGRIKDSYDHYLKALELNPHDAYAMKGIAWILYSDQKDTAGAKEILNSLIERNSSPDYLLLMAEIEEYEGHETEKSKWINQYLDEVSKPEYGVMYNKYRIQLLAEEKQDFAQAKKLSQDEVNMRPTPQSYSLLAWSQFLAGEKDEALKIIESKINGKTYEPEPIFYATQIYKANDRKDKVEQFKPDLIESIYELGPIIGKKIRAL
jgi:tetratricopeptide (TPR) repeat protein